MGIINWKCISCTFSMICLFATIGLSIYALYRFSNDEDTTLVRVTKFLSSKDAIYPSLSFCILPPFLEKQFKIYGDNSINMTSYIEFLDGEIWDDRFLKVDYDNVTVSLIDNILELEYETHVASRSNKIMPKNMDTYHYVSFRSSKRKCFTIDAPFCEDQLLYDFAVNINKRIFSDGKMHSPQDTSWMYTCLHYPGQRFTAYYTLHAEIVPRQNKINNYEMEFSTKNIEVITRRNRIREPCEEDWRNYDTHIMEGMMKKAGCRPSHWKTILDLPICSKPNQMKTLSRQPNAADIDSFIQPCKVISQLDYTYKEYDDNDDKEG